MSTIQLTDTAFVSRLLVMKPRLPDIPFLPLGGSVLQQIYGFQHVRGELGMLPSKPVNKALSLSPGEGGWLLERLSLPPSPQDPKPLHSKHSHPLQQGISHLLKRNQNTAKGFQLRSLGKGKGKKPPTHNQNASWCNQSRARNGRCPWAWQGD